MTVAVRPIPTASRTSHLMKGVPAMDIYSILSSKPHNPHYLNRYITFIEQCQQNNVGYEFLLENHHICPKADDMFPEYVCFKTYPWNKAALTPRQHFIAHIILWKCFYNTVSCSKALWFMSNGVWKQYSNYSKRYHILRKEISDDKKGKVVAKDRHGKFITISKKDPKWKNGELVGISAGMVTVKDKNEKVFNVSVSDPRYLLGELVHVAKGIVTVKEKNGNTFSVSTEDPRYLSGELISISFGMVAVKDKKGNKLKVSIDDLRLKTGELVGINAGMVVVKNRNGDKLRVPTDDPRLKTEELVGINAGMRCINDGKKNRKIAIDEEIPFGWKPGLLIRNNPSCWINDGKKTRKIAIGEEIPFGWKPGRAGTRTQWINDGKKSKRIKPNETIPEGWVVGRV